MNSIQPKCSKQAILSFEQFVRGYSGDTLNYVCSDNYPHDNDNGNGKNNPGNDCPTAKDAALNDLYENSNDFPDEPRPESLFSLLVKIYLR